MTRAPHLVHLAVAQFKPRKADYAGNLARVRTLFAETDALEPRPSVLCLPETALTGYFLEGGVREVAMTAGTLAQDLDDAYREAVSAPRTLDVAIGFYEVWRNRLFNSAMYVTLGGGPSTRSGLAGPHVRHVHRKVFLPTYGMFDEERFVERGRDVRAFETPWGRAALLVCEDAWHSLTGTIAALDGAQVIIVPTAPPARGPWPKQDGVPGPSSASRWERLARDMAEEHGVFVVLANLVGSEGGKLFPGASMVAGPMGDVRARGPVWEEALVTVTLDLRDVTHARADMPLVADLETMLPHLQESLAMVTRREAHSVEFDGVVGAVGSGAARPEPVEGWGVETGIEGAISDQRSAIGSAAHAPRPTPAFPVHASAANGSGCPHPLQIDPVLTEEWLVRFIREEMDRRGFERAVVGVSGGVDSAVTVTLAARALGPQNVYGIRMPYRTSSPDSLDHAQLLIESLGINCRTVDISDAVDGYLRHEPDAEHGRRGNVMARMRMITLFDLSAKYRAIPLGTGNKTERLFGYFTWHADDSPPINPLGDLFKTQVWALAKHLGIPDVIVSKPPSADLVVGQTDEGDFGISYAKADEILNWMLSGYDTAQLIERGFDRHDVELVRKRLQSTHWKRRLPTVALMSPTAIGESYLRPVDY